MNHMVFSIYDAKAEAFLPPLFFKTQGIAWRAFRDCVNDAGHAFNAHPEDYSLFRLGVWEDNSAAYIAEPQPVSIVTGLELVDTMETVSQNAQGEYDIDQAALENQLNGGNDNAQT